MTSAPLPADTILAPSWLLTVNERFDILENHALVIRDGNIIDIVDKALVRERYQGEWINLEGQVLLPGFVNSHNHAAMSLLRGFAEDKALQSWLQDDIWPTEGKWMSEDFVRDGTLLACAEMLRSGTTCVNDMYFFPDIAAQVFDACQMRACLSFPVLEFPSAWAQDADEYIDKGLALHDHYRHHARIDTAFGPHAPYTVKQSNLERIAMLAQELDSNIHIHLHENAEEVADYRKQQGQSAIEHWAELGLLTPNLQAVHMTQLSDREIELVAEHNVKVVHCPESNMKLASGMAPIQKLLDAGVLVALGTDGCASNNDLDMLGEMKSAGLLGKLASGDASAMKAENLLRMATINGARMLGLDAVCGSLEIGKSADCISIAVSNLDSSPLYHVTSHLIYSGSREQVKNVWVAGKRLMNNRHLSLIDEDAVIKKATRWQQKISAKA